MSIPWKALFNLSNSHVSFTHCLFNHTTQGALSLSNSNLSLSNCSFENTSVYNIEYPSIQHNIYCSGSDISSIELKSLYYNQQQIQNTTSLWMFGEHCELKDPSKHNYPPSYQFIPTLTQANLLTSSTSQELTNTDDLTFIFEGALFIPCSLYFSLLLSDQTTIEHIFDSPMSSNETYAEFSLPSSSIPNNETLYVAVSVLPTTSTAFSLTSLSNFTYSTPPLKVSDSTPTQSSSNNHNPIILLVVIFAVNAFILSLLLFIIISRSRTRCRKKDNKLDVPLLTLTPTPPQSIPTEKPVSISTSIPTFNGNESGDFFEPDTLNPQIEYI